MMSSLKKLALDQKVSKLLYGQTNEQTVRSDQRFIKARNAPQTTKYINHKCQIKKNLFNQQKENIPQGFLTIQFESNRDQKQKTIKFVTEKSLHEKKENFQYLFNAMDERDQSQTIKVFMKQKQEITELKKIIQDFQAKEKLTAQHWFQEKQQLLKQLKDLRDENQMMKSEINKMTLRIEDKSRYRNFQQQLRDFNQQNDVNSNKINQFDETQEDTVISRMITKVQRVSKELQYFIDLSHKFKNEAQQASQLLSVKASQLQMSQDQLKISEGQVCQLKEALNAMKEKSRQQMKSYKESETLLKSQTNAYKDEYELLRKRYFIMQSEFRKYSSALQAKDDQNLKEKHEVLSKKYARLYESYKVLYEEYINRSRETDFIMELADSNCKEIRHSGERVNLEGSEFLHVESVEYARKALAHLPQETLQECSEITVPVSNAETCGTLICHPKIILKDLIKETLSQCKTNRH